MIRLVEQGRADRAMTLFDPDFLLKVSAQSSAGFDSRHSADY